MNQPPQTLDAALERIAQLEKSLADERRATVRSVLNLFEPDGFDFHYNEAKNTGWINLRLVTGAGPSIRMRGEDITAPFLCGLHNFCGTGRFRLNDEAVKLVLERLQDNTVGEQAAA